MKNMLRLIVAFFMIVGWSLAALSLHVVRDGKRVVVIPKQSLDWHDIYVDTSKWTMDDVAAHPAVVKRLIQNEKADVLQHIAPDVKADALPALLKAAIERGPVKPSTQPMDKTVA